MVDLSNLLSDKLFLQYLAGAGADIASGKPLGANVNAITEQNIKAQNFSKMLGQMLGGGGKVTLDKDNINIKAPATSLKGDSQPSLLNSSGGGDIGINTMNSPEISNLLSQYLGESEAPFL